MDTDGVAEEIINMLETRFGCEFGIDRGIVAFNVESVLLEAEKEYQNKIADLEKEIDFLIDIND